MVGCQLASDVVGGWWVGPGECVILPWGWGCSWSGGVYVAGLVSSGVEVGGLGIWLVSGYG